MHQRVHQVFAHRDQRGGAAGREIEPAEQLLPARLGGEMQFGRGLVGALARPGIDRRVDALAIDRRSASPAPRRTRCAGRWSARRSALRISRASATPEASPRPDSSSSHSSTRLAERAAASPRRSRARSISARPRSEMVCNISPKKEVFIHRPDLAAQSRTAISRCRKYGNSRSAVAAVALRPEFPIGRRTGYQV